MQVRLMFTDRQFDPDHKPPPTADELITDLQLQTLFETMASGDRLLYQIVSTALLCPLQHPEQIQHRQQVLTDCWSRPEPIRQIYGLASDALQAERHASIGLPRSPRLILQRAMKVLDALLPFLKQLATLAQQELPLVSSPGLTQLYQGLISDLDEQFFADAAEELHQLRFPNGVIIGKRLGQANVGVDDLLRPPAKEPVMERLGLSRHNTASFQIPARDEAGADALEAIKDRGVNQVADAAGQAADFLSGFFVALRYEIGFYLGCLNLSQRLRQAEQPVSLPQVSPAAEQQLTGSQLYDPCLALTNYQSASQPIVRNDLAADNAAGIVITGANSGGKSTFLRALGLAEVMTHCGMFVPAHEFQTSIRTHIVSHFAREEDSTMARGRFDDELVRMSTIIDRIGPEALILMNESFSSTDEREAADLGSEIMQAFANHQVRFVFVTHNYDLAQRIQSQISDLVCLRAERLNDGSRTYRIIGGKPLPTSFGQDIYHRLGGWQPVPIAS